MTEYMENELLKELNYLRKEVLKIALSDEEKYNYFINKINEVKQEMAEVQDQGYDLSTDFFEKVEKVKTEIGMYFRGENEGVELCLEDNQDDNSGKRAIRKHRIELYKSIAETMKRKDIDIKELKMIISKWKEEKEGELRYKPVEIEYVEECIADIFLEYKIKYITKDKRIPLEEYSEFCSTESYEKLLRERLIQTIKSLEKGNMERFKLEELLVSGTLKELDGSIDLWRAIVGVETLENNKDVIDKQKNEVALVEHTEMVKNKKTKPGKMKIVITDKNGNEKEKYISLTRDGEIRVPEKYKDRIVKAIVPEGVQRISYKKSTSLLLGKYNTCFSDCKSLSYVELPSTLRIIDEKAFFNCKKLCKVDLTRLSGFLEVKDRAFEQCQILNQIGFEKIVYIGKEAFKDCKCLGSDSTIEFSKDLQKIGTRAFMNTGIKEITVPNVERGKGVFSYCRLLETVDIEEGVEEIEGEEFFYCNFLYNVTLPKTLKVIKDEAFIMCSNLREIQSKSNIKLKGNPFNSDVTIKKKKHKHKNQKNYNKPNGKEPPIDQDSNR